MPEKKLISIVVPIYNEQENISRLYEKVIEVLAPLSDRYRFEFIFTDNHSTDKSFPLLRKLAQRDSRVKVIRFSRNFGYQNSIYTGYNFSRGDAAVQLDCDLQDPPELILQFLEKWEQGYKVVYGVRRRRKEGFFITWTRKVFYRIIDFLSQDSLPKDAGDFRLVDRCILDELKSIYDANPYIRGIIATLGYEQIGIDYDRDARIAGKSKFNYKELFKLAMDGIVSVSVVPLRIATYLGFIATLVALALILFFTHGRFFGDGNWPRGFATLTLLILGGIGLNGLFLGIIGEYLGRIYLQVRARPLVVVERTLNLEKNISIPGPYGSQRMSNRGDHSCASNHPEGEDPS